ncbi:hypothetical protein LINPERPRIM_LOCUS41258 [Linum perenne]
MPLLLLTLIPPPPHSSSSSFLLSLSSINPKNSSSSSSHFTAASKGSPATKSSKEEKGLLDFILGGLTKQDQFYETDPILQKVKGKSAVRTGTTSGRNNMVVVRPGKKNGTTGLGGLFDKKGVVYYVNREAFAFLISLLFCINLCMCCESVFVV